MKTVFSSQKQVAHIWAQQNHPKGKCNGGLFFEGATIYSYGYHFPCATFINDETVLINSDSCSVFTSKQQSYVRSDINHKKEIFCSTAVIKAFLWDKSFNEQAQSAALRECKYEVERNIKRAKAKKAAKYKANDINSARSAISTCKGLFEAFKTEYPAILLEIESLVSGDDFDAIIKADKERLEKERLEKERLEKERLEREAKEQARIAEQERLISKYIQAWYIHALPEHYTRDDEAWGALSAIQSSKKIFMRIARSDDEIETSKGARFPIDHAKRVFSLIRNCHDGKFIWIRAQIDERVLSRLETTLGHFEINMIASDGTVKAACHTVQWDEIERLATILEIYP